jgi:WD40 repeat protein
MSRHCAFVRAYPIKAFARTGAVVLLFVFSFLFPAEVVAAKRVALVVANSDYQHTRKLPNPSNDAALISERLKKLGFDVRPHENVNAEQFSDILQNLAASLDRETEVLFYYAGHGLQYKDENWLVGIDARLASEPSLQRETVGLNTIMDLLERHAGTTLLFWDACRNNPLASALLPGAANGSPAPVVGAAPISARRGNTFVVFSAAPGKEAIDGSGGNSPFAKALADHIATPDVEIESMITTVATEVRQSTGDMQEPEQLSRLSQRFYFKAEGSAIHALEAENRRLRAKIIELERERQRRPPVRFKIDPVPLRSDPVPQAPQESSIQTIITRTFFSERPAKTMLAVNRPLATIIRRIRVSPDGKILAIGGDDGVIRLVSLETFAVVRAIKAHTGRISDLDFSPDGGTLLSTGRDGTARLWRVQTGALAGEPLKIDGTPLYSGRINSALPDRFVVIGDRKGRLYAKDLKRNKLVTQAKFHSGPVHALAYQPKGKGTYFSAGADGLVKLRLPEGQRMVVKAHEGVISQADYDPTGTVAYTAGYDRKIKIWETKKAFSQTPLHVLEGHFKYVLAAGISRTNKMLVSGGGDKAVNVWSVGSGKLMARLEGHTNDVEAVTFTSDNRFVISTSEDKSMRIWSVENREELVRMFFRTGGENYAGLTFDDQIFGDQNSGLFSIRVDGKEVPAVDRERYVKYLGRGISISND